MTLFRDGIAASPGIAIGPARLLEWERPPIPRASVTPENVESEVAKFQNAREWAKRRIREIQQSTAERLGAVEAQIFDPQLAMLDDAELVDTTIAYIRENRLSAARAFELRVLEFRSQWRRTGHSMVMDRLVDLLDMELRVLRRILGLPDLDPSPENGSRPYILVAHDLTPTLAVQLDRSAILGVATDAGTRASHFAILARALHLPAVVSLGDLSELVESDREVILDGREGRVIVDPGDREKRLYRERDKRLREWEQELVLISHLDAVTSDGQPVTLRANIDLPGDADTASQHGAEGIGLFRTEFLVVGRSTPPEEEGQYHAYRRVTELFPHDAVYIRTFDLGGDKFPLFLDMPREDNPFLGWRAIRVCLDTPELFRKQLRALIRATAHGDVRFMLPLVNEIDEVRRTRAMLSEIEDDLRRNDIPFNAGYKLGIMIETPAAVLLAPELARHVDFFSVGTNDLVQYTLAVDRGNPRLAPRYTPFHPAVLDLLRRTAVAGEDAGLEVSVCGELASNPLGVFMLLGLGITVLSASPTLLPEIKKVIRSIPIAGAREAVERAGKSDTPQGVVDALTSGLSEWLDLSLFASRWNLSAAS